MKPSIFFLLMLFATGTVHAEASLQRCKKQYLAIENIEKQLKQPQDRDKAARLKTRKQDLQEWLRENCRYDTRDYLLD